MESGPPLQHFICPKEKNHKFDTKERLIKHLSNCKLLKGIPEFLSCKYETYHLFATPFEKEEHEKKCHLKNRLKGEEPPVSNFKIKNPGFDPSFQPKKIDTSFYNVNKERLLREEQEIKAEKAKVRVNIADVAKKNEAVELLDEGKVTFSAALDTGFLKMSIRILDIPKFQLLNADFSRQTIFRLTNYSDAEFLAKLHADEVDIIGDLYIHSDSSTFKQQLNTFKHQVLYENRILQLKDKKENIFVVVGISRLKRCDKLVESDTTLKHTSILVLFHKKSSYFQDIMQRAQIEKEIGEQIAINSTEASAIEAKRKELAEEANSIPPRRAFYLRTLQSHVEELTILQKRLEGSDEAFSQNNYEANAREIATLKKVYQEKYESFPMEMKSVREQRMNEYKAVMVEELSKANQKLAHYRTNAQAIEENIQKIKTYMLDTQKMTDSYKAKVDSTKALIEACKETLTKEKDHPLPAQQKKGVVLNKAMNCRLCHSSYVSMVTKPCMHCILCWSCFHGFVQNGLKNCLACGQRVEFCFKIKFL